MLGVLAYKYVVYFIRKFQEEIVDTQSDNQHRYSGHSNSGNSVHGK